MNEPAPWTRSDKLPADEWPPDMVAALFGLRGRIGRGRYWIGIGVVVGFLFVTVVFLAQGMSPTGGGGAEILAFPAFFAALWVHAAVTIKRLRDMGWSTWLYLGLMAAFAGALYVGTEAAEASGGASLLLVVLVLALPGVVQTRPPDAEPPAP
ncbi:DUF805 domain-containing protein [Xanthobacteraceae bacterium Astr-EGSB]|uniref:DUF805 domain-containing protein n=1 Tax=Astrobacterium formosum TaxID=3069710 RepID=UPI0027B152AD|nr:DUF805 domain-containing protein [Xanthobacteraceae bacterium Astr-EGSB]